MTRIATRLLFREIITDLTQIVKCAAWNILEQDRAQMRRQRGSSIIKALAIFLDDSMSDLEPHIPSLREIIKDYRFLDEKQAEAIVSHYLGNANGLV